MKKKIKISIVITMVTLPGCNGQINQTKVKIFKWSRQIFFLLLPDFFLTN